MPWVWCIACEAGYLASEDAADYFCPGCGVWIWASDSSCSRQALGERSAQVVRGDEAVAPVRASDEPKDMVSPS